MRANLFELKPEHLKLLQRMYVGWQDYPSEAGGAPDIDPKRPYGNKWVAGDVTEILGWPTIDRDEGSWDPALEERCHSIHREMETALQIVLCCQTFEPGLYRKRDAYDSLSWELVKAIESESEEHGKAEAV